MPPAVSVLLPFYNAAGTLARCLDSLSAQTHPDFEVIAVDDGSSDDGAAVVARHAARDSRFRLLSRPHCGIVAALNAGLAASKGAFIARMDADDVSLPERLAKQYAYMSRHAKCDLVGCLAEPMANDGALGEGVARYHAWMNRLRDDDAIKANLFVESPIPHSGFFARRGLYQRLGGYRDPPWPEDYDFLLRAAEAGATFGKVAEILLRRLDWPGRLTRRDPRYKREAMFRAKAHYFARGDWLRHKNGVVIGGSGTSGRKVAALLRAGNVPLRCFLDNRTGPPLRRVMDLPAFGYPEEIPAEFFAAHRDAFYLSCIGEDEGRARLVHHLHLNGFRQGRDYLLFM